ncbi:MAG: pyridoxal phosphate-dependent aminotransferase [Gemmatimonadota bacterium]|nr:pyridoxal phosphate-dependent aminotransferase [Gemmatimonadota bacterium]MDH3421767.1 pyridoxal phosphate-dependent aminotransferase [Gemmatimonadota bacterium]
MHLSENVSTLKPSATMAVSSLAKRLASEGRDILNLSAGEPDFDTPGFVCDAAIDGIKAGATRYTPPAGTPQLRKAIAARLAERAGREIDWEGVVVTAGAKQALFNAIFTLFGPGDEVLILSPYWTTYPALVSLARAEPVVVEGDATNDFKVGPAELEAASTGRTRGVVLNSPSNPTGAVYTSAELAAIVAWAKERDVWILSDEIYRSIYYGSEGVAAPGLLDLPESALGPYVLIDGASKCFAMTGWRIGFTYAPRELSNKFAALQSQMTSNPTTPSQVASLAAYTQVEAADAAVAEMVRAFKRRRDLVTTRMRELLPGVEFVDPVGAFYLYFRVDSFFDDEVTGATAWCSKLLEEQGVALVPGAAFGDDRWVRMSFATSDDVLEEALARIAAGVAAASPS